MRHLVFALLVACGGGKLTIDDGGPTDGSDQVADSDVGGTTDSDTVPPDTDVVDDDSDPPVEDTDAGGDTDVVAPRVDRCLDRHDVGVLSTEGDAVEQAVGACTAQCFRSPPLGPCVAQCLSQATSLTIECSSCFGGMVACVATQCTRECLDPSSADCGDCASQRCGPGFETCSGVPLP